MAEPSVDAEERLGREVLAMLGVLLAVASVVAVLVFGFGLGGPGDVRGAAGLTPAPALDPERVAVGWGVAGSLVAVAAGIILTTDWRGSDGSDPRRR